MTGWTLAEELRARAEVERELLAPGSPFSIARQEVLGEELAVFEQRAPHLRALLSGSTRFGDLPYLVFPDLRLSFREHLQAVSALAATFEREYGIGKGDRVAILGANAPEWALAFWATISLGAIAVAMNGWWVGDEIDYALSHAEPKLLVVDKQRAERLSAPIPRGTAVLRFSSDEHTNGDSGTQSDFWTAIQRGRGAVLSETPIAEDDPAILLYTSGTTGRPKGALHSHRNVIALLGVQFFHGARLMKLRERAERDRASGADADATPPPQEKSEPAPQHCRLVSNPLFHVSGLHASLIAHLAGGVKSVWTTGRFSAEKVLAAMQAEQVNGWGPQGSMAYRVLQCPTRKEYDVSSVTSIGCGGAPVTPEIQAALREAFPNAVQGLAVGYGQTECTALATMNYGGELREYPESVGQALPTVDVEIRDPQGNRLPDGEEGDIFIRSPLVMLGYWKDPEATAKAIHPGRWLQTGDFGRLDSGRLYIHTRKRDLILRAAENVYPAEIERRLDAHPDVAESAVFGVDHPELGQSVKAVVVPKPGKKLDIEALRAWAAGGLAYYKVPEGWELRDAPLPRNASGKIVKYLLQDVAESAPDLEGKRG